MIFDPNLKENNKFGVQGSLSFNKTNPNLNIELYREIEKFLKGDLGLGGSGGAMANRVRSSSGFQESHVFDSASTRQRVKKRMETQLSEFLESSVGDAASNSGMDIPSYLRSQGINGISSTGRGANQRLSMYSNDDFVETSQNPLTGSTEKMARAYMQKIGAVNAVSGGTNAKRRLHGYLRPEEAQHVSSMTRQTAFELEAGVYSKGDLEALYGSEVQRSQAKSLRHSLRDDLTTRSLEGRSPSAVAEMRSQMLKQQEQKKVYSEVKQEMIASGELEDDTSQKRKESPAALAAKGATTVLSRISTTLGTMKALTAKAVSYLQGMASYFGGLQQKTAPLGITAAKAKQLANWGDFNPVYSNNNPNILLDAARDFATSFGSILKGSKAKLDHLAYYGDGKLIGPMMNMAKSKQPRPVEMMQLVYDSFARKYFKTRGARSRSKLLAKQSYELEETFGGAAAKGYAAMVHWGAAAGVKSGKNFTQRALRAKTGTYSQGGVIELLSSGMRNGPVGSKESQKHLSDILGTLNAIRDALMRTLLANMGTITSILLSIAKGILKFIPAKGARAMKKRLDTMNVALGRKGYSKALQGSFKISKRVRKMVGANAAAGILDTNNSTAEIVQKVKGATAGIRDYNKRMDMRRELITHAIANKKLKADMYEYNSQTGTKWYTGLDGDMGAHYNRAASDTNVALSKFKIGGASQYRYFQDVAGQRVRPEDMKAEEKVAQKELKKGRDLKWYYEEYELIKDDSSATELEKHFRDKMSKDNIPEKDIQRFLDKTGITAEKQFGSNFKGSNGIMLGSITDGLGGVGLSMLDKGLSQSAGKATATQITNTIKIDLNGRQVLSTAENLESTSNKNIFNSETQTKVIG